MSAQIPPIEPGVSHELAKWRAAHYSDVRYKLTLTLEKMSPALKGTIEIRVKVGTRTLLSASPQSSDVPPIILDWRKIKGHEEKSTISRVHINGIVARSDVSRSLAENTDRTFAVFEDRDEHLIFREGVVAGENLITLDFTSPILTSGSAITRYIDKEDRAEYIYSLFVPSDASTAFPVFDQPDLKARFELVVTHPQGWNVVSNSAISGGFSSASIERGKEQVVNDPSIEFAETQPISTYVFAFAAGPWERVSSPGVSSPHVSKGSTRPNNNVAPSLTVGLQTPESSIYVRRSQAAKFNAHAAEVFRLNREAIKYLEGYFDYKFPFPKYDLVLIPEFPFGGMEHAGATFLREDRIIFPQEPTKNDYITRANLMFHEAAHQWFGDTVTMKWFDDLWLKEGFAEFMAYKTLEKVMPEYNAWKVFYERNKQAAYLTDSTKGTTPIYQEIANLNAAKSAYGNIVYRKAPSFLKQAEFYIGPDNFQKAVRSLLKKHEFANAGWEDLVKEFETASGKDAGTLKPWAEQWVKQPGLPVIRGVWSYSTGKKIAGYRLTQKPGLEPEGGAPRPYWTLFFNLKATFADGTTGVKRQFLDFEGERPWGSENPNEKVPTFVFPNYEDYGYGIFLLDDKSRDYVLKNIHAEKDDFLRTMMWGSLWDSVREAELDPKQYVELVVKNLSLPATSQTPKRRSTTPASGHPSYPGGEQDESTIQTLLGRVSIAMKYYLPEQPMQKPARELGRNIQRSSSALPNGRASAPQSADALQTRVEAMLIENMQNASTPGQRITYYRAFLNLGSSPNARRIMKIILKGGNAGGPGRIATKDKFDVVTRLMVLGDPDAPKLLADLEKTETSDEAKRYAYAARAGLATAANKAKYWNDFVNNKEISESWIEAAFGPWNSTSHSALTLPYLERALKELPNHKRNRKIFFVNGWLGAFIGGQRSEEALDVVNKFLADNPTLDRDLRLKILENVDVIERAVKIRAKFGRK